ncbi:MAG: hypothetical protein WDO24_25140 [Pseudomonadota bacterium]
MPCFDPLPGWSLQGVASWILTEGRLIGQPARLLEGLVQALGAAGAPVQRISIAGRHVASADRVLVVYWDIKIARVDHERRARGIVMMDAYIGSPVQPVRERGETVRRRLQDVGPDDHSTFHDLVAAGMTDYLAMPMLFSDGHYNFISFATQARGGFTDADITKLSTLPIWLGADLRADRAAQRRRHPAEHLCRQPDRPPDPARADPARRRRDHPRGDLGIPTCATSP